jgi:hypothetical protein
MQQGVHFAHTLGGTASDSHEQYNLAEMYGTNCGSDSLADMVATVCFSTRGTRACVHVHVSARWSRAAVSCHW